MAAGKLQSATEEAELKQSRRITDAIASWCVLSVALAIAVALPRMHLSSGTELLIWVGVHVILAGAAAVVAVGGRRMPPPWFRFRPAEMLLLLSAFAWGIGGVWFGRYADAAFNIPVVVTVSGLTCISVWLFGGEALLSIAVLVCLLTPVLFTLIIGGASNWATAAVILLVLVANLLISRRAQNVTGHSATRGPALQERDVARMIAEAKFDSEQQNTALREELERHKNVEEELKLAKQVAEAASMAKGEFLATMSHEIRTPLNGIIPLLEILRDTKLQPDQRDYLNTAYSSSKHLLRIIDDILDYSKIEANKLELEQVGLNIKDLVDAVVRLMEKPAESKGLRMQVAIDPNVRMVARGDPVRLRQVLMNLVSNAVKFTDKGSVQIQVSKRAETRTHTEILFAVRDTGIGVAPDVAEKLFKPFSQADASTTRIHGGTGLGLVICKRIIDLMQGKIGLKSEVGKGSIFWFSVPLAKVAGDVTGNRKDLSGARALIVSNDPRVNQRLVTYFQAWNMSHVSATTTADAISKLKSSATLGENWAVDVAVVDLASMRNTAPAMARNVLREPSLERLKLVFVLGDEPAPSDIAPEGRGAMVPRMFSEGELMGALNKLLEVDQPGERRFNLLEEAARLGVDDRAEQPSTAPGTPMVGRVLLVEDNPVNRQVAQRLIGLLGLEYDVAENGKEALEKLGKGGYDLVLMDCQMPIMDGYTATRSRRTLEAERKQTRIPIVAMTANAMAGDREKCLVAGMDDYLSKPLNRQLLEQTVRKWLPIKTGAVAPRPTASPGQAPPAAPTGQPVIADIPRMLTEPLRVAVQPATGPAIDKEVVNELLDVMGSEFGSLVRVYLEDAPKSLRVLVDAADRGDVEGMIAPAHSLKSTSANLGALGLAEVAKKIEHGARLAQIGDPTTLARQATAEFQRAAEELRKLIA